ncbi:hypothetical protein AUR04nite_14480 [Glutamicibacter uratoxydans]|uniref:Uncharacterized protein n=1 Tax=Glutamicibacter uratoxydans TaxID=43667 RepID=A0A4Y4DLV7_GLUUR|nr:hypothetical protein [Glutamicibacter uratoxydans]GED05916.1 hypothetical protein AUR04nite_14480 [Glutamicibacter uratoxydans]
MNANRINPYTGLPPKRNAKFTVIQLKGQDDRYVIIDASGAHQSRILTKPQLDIATQHTINAASSPTSGALDDLGQALVNFRYEHGAAG